MAPHLQHFPGSDHDFRYREFENFIGCLTGGQFFHVDPTKNGGIQAVMDTIIQKITATSLPRTVQITNNTVGQTSVAVHDSLDANQNLDVTLDSIIALAQGTNNITVSVTQSDGTQNTYSFNVQADGPASGQSTSSLVCYAPPTLAMLNAQGLPDSLYTLNATSYTIRLTRTPNDVGPVVVTATSIDAKQPAGWGDSEFVSLPVGTPAGGMAVYQGPYPFNGIDPAPVKKNGTLETDAGGEIVLNWSYPRDPRESVTYTLFGNQMPVTLPPTATPPGHNFTTLDSAFSVTLTPGETGAVIHYTLDGSTPDSNSAIYIAGQPIPINASTTIKAIDTKPFQLPSPVASFVYTESQAPKVATPVATPPGPGKTGYTFDSAPLAVVLSDTTPGATIHYSFDSSATSTGTNVFVSQSETLHAYATKAGYYPSDTLTIHYTFIAPSLVYVQFPNGQNKPSHDAQIPVPSTPPNVAFVPIDQRGVPLPGSTDGKCGTCGVGGGTQPFAGPIINLEIPGPSQYHFQIYSKYGDFIISGSGQIDAADIPLLSLNPDGSKHVARIIWTGRSANGTQVGTGAYILRSTITPLSNTATSLPGSATLLLFGFVR